MPNYYIRANGMSRTKEQLMNMLLNLEHPDRIEIVGILNEGNPISKKWTFSREGQHYRMTALDISLGGAGLLRAGVDDRHIVEVVNLADTVLEAIDFFGPDAVSVNAPPREAGNNPGPFGPNYVPGPMPPLARQNAMGWRAANAAGNNPGPFGPNYVPGPLPQLARQNAMGWRAANANARIEPQDGGRGRKRRASQRRKATRRRASQRRRH